MRFPSVVTLANRGREVLVRFPWTMAAGIVAAVAVRIRYDSVAGLARVAVGEESLLFDLHPLLRMIATDSTMRSDDVPAERLRFQATAPTRRGVLALESLFGSSKGDSVRVRGWEGTLFVGKAK
jgi:hypothetical protein